MTLAKLLDEIKENHKRIYRCANRLNDPDSRDILIPYCDQLKVKNLPMYYSDLELIDYFTKRIYELQKDIEIGKYEEENNYEGND